MSKKDKKTNLLPLAAAGTIGGVYLYEHSPYRIKYRNYTKNIKPLSPNEKILIVHSDATFGSGHTAQAKALVKELRKKGFNNIEQVAIQEAHPFYRDKKVDNFLYNLYQKKRQLGEKIPDHELNEWTRSYYYNQIQSTNNLAKHIKDYDRVIFLTGDASEAISRPFSKLRKEILKKNAPITHLVYTDRAVPAKHLWWNTLGLSDDLATTSRFDSVYVPDKKSLLNHYLDPDYGGQINAKYVRGLSVDVDNVKIPKDAKKIRYFVHGGSTGVNVPETTESLLHYFKQNKSKGNALVVFGPNSVEKDKINSLKKLIDEFNASSKDYKIYYTDSLLKPEMNYYLRNADINFGAGGTTYEELGKLGKPSLYTYSSKNKTFSHPSAFLGIFEKYDKVLDDYLKNVKNVKDIPNTEYGLGRLTGSELIESDNPIRFSERLERFEKELPARQAIAVENSSTFGRGAEDIVNDMMKGDKTVKYTGRRIPRFITIPAVSLSSGYLAKHLLDKYRDKNKKRNKLKEGVLIGTAAGLGALLTSVPSFRRLINQIKQTKRVPNLTESIRRNVEAIVDSLVNYKKSTAAKLYKNN